MKHDFHIGDIVKMVGSCQFPDGTTAEIMSHANDLDLNVRVDMDKPMGGCHSCGGLCENGYGWTIGYSKLRLVNMRSEDPDIANSELMSIFGGGCL